MISKIKNIGKIITWDSKKDAIDINQSKNLEILIEDGCISSIGQDLNKNNIDNIIDARGGLVTPGFIDCHTHSIFSGDKLLITPNPSLSEDEKLFNDLGLHPRPPYKEQKMDSIPTI